MLVLVIICYVFTGYLLLYVISSKLLSSCTILVECYEYEIRRTKHGQDNFPSISVILLFLCILFLHSSLIGPGYQKNLVVVVFKLLMFELFIFCFKKKYNKLLVEY